MEPYTPFFGDVRQKFSTEVVHHHGPSSISPEGKK